nr:MAG TPA: hypothetical protein [Caudoviricetes sp.]
MNCIGKMVISISQCSIQWTGNRKELLNGVSAKS